RHTRFSRDWSSDVCSSDLGLLETGTELAAEQFALPVAVAAPKINIAGFPAVTVEETENSVTVTGDGFSVAFDKTAGVMSSFKKEIGRASCREREEIVVNRE